MKTYKLTQANLKTFTLSARKYLKLYGLTNWEVHMDFVEMDDSLACCSGDAAGRMAVLGIAPEWIGVEPTKKALDHAALHEVLELLLWDLSNMISDRNIKQETVDTVRHSVIRRLEAATI